MTPVRARIEIDAPAAAVWTLIAEFVHWPEWGPSVRAVEAGTGSVEPGVSGRVRTPLGIWLPFTIETVEPGRSWDWRVAGIRATGHRVEPLDSARCAVEFSAPRLAAPYVWVLRRGLRSLKELAERAPGRRDGYGVTRGPSA